MRPRSATAGAGDGAIRFEPVSLTTLVDSPVLAGTPPAQHPSRRTAAALRLDLDRRQRGRARHRRRKVPPAATSSPRRGRCSAPTTSRTTIPLTLSDQVAHFGLEHHESSDDRTGRALLDDDRRSSLGSSSARVRPLVERQVPPARRAWRRATTRADAGRLLWVYEGLTEYLGNILTARTGLRTPEQFRDDSRRSPRDSTTGPGEPGDPPGHRRWRRMLYNAPGGMVELSPRRRLLRRGSLLWLDVDTIIRRLTKGGKSIEDFCGRSTAAEQRPPDVKPYTSTTWSRRWSSRAERLAGFFVSDSSRPVRTRISAASTRRLESRLQRHAERDPAGDGSRRQATDARFSLGILVETTAGRGRRARLARRRRPGSDRNAARGRERPPVDPRNAAGRGPGRHRRARAARAARAQRRLLRDARRGLPRRRALPAPAARPVAARRAARSSSRP